MRSPIPSGDAATPDAVLSLLRKFDYPDTETSPVNIQPGGGGGAPTIVVASSDSSEASKSKADLVCTGVNDQDVIQSAIDSIEVGGVARGRVLLTEGNFSINVPSGGAAITLGSFSSLQGLGPEASYLVDDTASDPGAGSSLITTATRSNKIFNLGIVSSWPNAPSIRMPSQAGFLWLDSINFGNSDASALKSADRPSNVWITNCFFDISDPTIPGLDFGSIRQLHVVNNRFSGGIRPIQIVDDAVGGFVPSRIMIANNQFVAADQEAIYIDGGRSIPSYTQILGNTISDCGGAYSTQQTTAAIRVLGDPSASHDISDTDSGEPQVKIVNNQIEGAAFIGGIRVDYLHQSDIRGNFIATSEYHGIQVVETSGANIAENRVTWPDGNDNTYDGIYVTGDSDQNYIHNNYIVNDVQSSLSWRYGINIADANAWCNIVVGNVFSQGFGTDALNDGGSNTILNYPSGAYGDNFLTCWGS